MKSDRRAPVAIIGAGFSGTMVAAHLARRGLASVMIEASDRAGQGTAFSTDDPAHLLNIPAGNMSAWPERPADFAERHGDPRGFAQRRHFGAYLRSILDEALATGKVELLNRRATGAERDGPAWRILLDGGDLIVADALVLATGNQPPAALAFAADADERLVANPWGPRASSAIRDAAERHLDIMILGAGLTMIDVVLSLDSAGHQGRMLALSRRGLLPRSHQAHEPAPLEWEEIPAGSARNLLHWLRKRSGAVGWRAAVDSIRPHSQRLWRSLGADQQRLFLRHARPWWDVHRHRIAPEVAAKLAGLIASGRLQVAAGRIASVRPAEDGLEVQVRKRGQDQTSAESFGYLFNCTGPLGEIGRSADPLIRSLLDEGLARPDHLGIGLSVDDASRAGERLWALGALTKGRYWEIIAVPDIRHQAALVAEDIATELGQ
ncbi:MAG: FAD/NAD(P)-binding protein [Sphingomonas sp.]|nr:FAD/NAD(P)-binding protein [Sphingomonas sp.]